MTDFSSLPRIGDAPAPSAASRFFRPPLPEGHIARPRLCQSLQQGLDGRLILLCAPAGFGKSSLASEFCETLAPHWRTLWLGLDARDSDPGRCLERLLDGLRLWYPGIGEDAMSLLRMRQRHQPFAFESWLDELLDELGDALSPQAPLLLVLDDYHLAQGAVLDRCLQFLLNHLPAGLVLLVTSRQRPDWHLARLRLARQLLALHEQDLRLTAGEIASLVDASGTQLSAEALASLTERSEGWIAGLRLWLLAHSDAPPGALREAVLSGSKGLIRDYLLEEVIDQQPPAVQDFLLHTARFDRFSAALCNELREAGDSAEILDYLHTHQVFLVPLDEHGQWFRYHHLFSDLLRARPLLDAGPSTAALHLRACRWFSAQGLLDDAVDQALRAGHLDVAASLVQSLSEEQLLAEQNVATLLRWKMDLPDALLASTPRLLVLYSWALALACQLDAAEELAERLARYLPAPSADAQRDLLAQWQAIAGVIARGRGDIGAAEQHCEDALQYLPEQRSGPRLLCLSSLSNLAVVRGDFWRARDVNREALALAQRYGNPLFEALVHYDRARVLQARGEVLRADDELNRGLARLADLPAQRRYAVRGRLQLYQGYLCALRLDTEQARRLLRAGIDEARACRDASLVIGHCVLASLEGRQGDYPAAFAQLAELERLMHLWDVPPVYYLSAITLVKCELWLGQGQLELAAAWLQRLADTYLGSQPATPPECSPQLPLYIALQQAQLARRQGHLVEAEQRLRELAGLAVLSGAQLPARQAQGLLLALLLQGAQRSAACAVFEECLAGAARGAWLPLHDVLHSAPAWLREHLHTRPACPVRERLLACLPDLPSAVGTQAETLSGRELAVLQLIAQGCSNQQISERLFISLHTVKSHARHINDKLGVERRTQAVARAQELGLLR
ncbi:MAG: HTH-type transcriptional regulator MalT [Pseudomonas citronellolis]|nr:MAG: HTH-type transcriptional regulator MalT [Pseudomonas citronellolis]